LEKIRFIDTLKEIKFIDTYTFFYIGSARNHDFHRILGFHLQAYRINVKYRHAYKKFLNR